MVLYAIISQDEWLISLDHHLEDYVLKSTQPGGFIKYIDTPEKREIRRISRLIITASNNINKSDKSLYLHFKNSIQKGQVFSYKPDRPMDWNLI